MKVIAVFFALTLELIAVAVTQAAPLQIATTLSTYAAIAQEIGGEFVEVRYVASPRFNPHFIEPKPSDVLRVKRSNLWAPVGNGWCRR